jgi:hypothetical protein
MDLNRELDTIEAELRLIAAVRWSIRENGGEASTRHADELLDERAEAIDGIDPLGTDLR